jgi:hypothetical protein
MHNHPESKIYLSEERIVRNILPRSLVNSSGATLRNTTESSYAAVVRNFSKGAKVRDNIEGYVKTDTRKILKGSPFPLKTNVPLLRSTETSESSWASRCTVGKADLGISFMSASTAIRTCPQLRRSTNTNGDVLRERSQT